LSVEAAETPPLYIKIMEGRKHKKSEQKYPKKRC
jgi:hypothetical protein